METVRITLTKDQQESLKPLYEKAILMKDRGNPGAILAQPFHGKREGEPVHDLDNIMVCSFIPGEKVFEISKILEDES